MSLVCCVRVTFRGPFWFTNLHVDCGLRRDAGGGAKCQCANVRAVSALRTRRPPRLDFSGNTKCLIGTHQQHSQSTHTSQTPHTCKHALRPPHPHTSTPCATDGAERARPHALARKYTPPLVAVHLRHTSCASRIAPSRHTGKLASERRRLSIGAKPPVVLGFRTEAVRCPPAAPSPPLRPPRPPRPPPPPRPTLPA